MAAWNNLLRFFSLRHLSHHPLRSLLNITGIALGVAVLLAVSMVNQSLLVSFRHMVSTLSGGAALRVSAGTAGVEERLAEVIEGVNGVAVALPTVSEVVYTPDGTPVLLLGVPFEKAGKLGLDTGKLKLNPMVFLVAPDAVILSAAMAGELEVKQGGTLRLRTPTGLRPFPVAGLFEGGDLGKAFGGNVAVMTLSAAGRVLQRPGRVDQVDVFLEEGADKETVRAALVRTLGGAYDVGQPGEQHQGAEKVLQGFNVGLTFASLVTLMVGAFLIYNTMSIAIAQRQRQLGMLRAIGATRRMVLTALLGEAFLLGLVGSLLGAVLGYALAWQLLSIMAKVVSAVVMNVHPGGVHVKGATVLACVAAGVGASVFAAWFAARTTVQRPPTDVLKDQVRYGERPWAVAGRRAKVALVGLGLSGVCLVWLFANKPTGETAALVGHVAAMLGALGFAWFAPAGLMVLRAVLRRTGLVHLSPQMRLAVENLPRNLDRGAVSAAAVMICLATVVTIAAFSETYQRRVMDWVGRIVVADLFVSSGSTLAQVNGTLMEEKLGRGIAQIDGVAGVDLLRFRRQVHENSRITVLSLIPEVYLPLAVARRDEQPPPDLFPAIKRREGVGVSDNFAANFGTEVGDTITLDTPKGKRDFKVVAVYPDFTSEKGTVLLSREWYKDLWGDPLVDVFDVYLEPGADGEAVRREIQRRWGKRYSLFVLNNEELRHEVVDLIKSTWKGVQVLEVVAIVISLLGVVNTLLASVFDRVREIGVLRALGMTRRRLVRMVLVEGLLLCFAGCVMGGVLGLLLAKGPLRAIVLAQTGFDLSMVFPHGTFWTVTALVLAGAVLASILPARQAAKLNLVEAIEYE